MDLREATVVLHRLADGIDPVSGERLPAGPYHHPQVIRALFTIVRHLDGEASRIEDGDSRPVRSNTLPERVGKPWTAAEDEQLIDEFHSGVEFREIARIHGRTRGGIISRLEKLGKFQARDPNDRPDVESNWATLKKTRTQAGKVWTSDEDASLIRLFDEGLDIEEIAERLHRGMNAIEVRLIKLGKRIDSESAIDISFDSL